MSSADELNRALTAARNKYREALLSHSKASENIKVLGPHHPDAVHALRIANGRLKAASEGYAEALAAYTNSLIREPSED